MFFLEIADILKYLPYKHMMCQTGTHTLKTDSLHSVLFVYSVVLWVTELLLNMGKQHKLHYSIPKQSVQEEMCT
jgi:hypothetical protein